LTPARGPQPSLQQWVHQTPPYGWPSHQGSTVAHLDNWNRFPLIFAGCRASLPVFIFSTSGSPFFLSFLMEGISSYFSPCQTTSGPASNFAPMLLDFHCPTRLFHFDRFFVRALDGFSRLTFLVPGLFASSPPRFLPPTSSSING